MKITLNRLRQIANEILSRKEWLQSMEPDRRRNLDDECGYPSTLTAKDYQRLYDRDAIAARVVEVLPKESWRVPPEIYEEESDETITPFEQALYDLPNNLDGGSYHRDERSVVLWNHLLQADIHCGIGQFGLLLLGLDDENSYDLSQPVSMREVGDAKIPQRKLLYLRSYPEPLVEITQWEQDEFSQRYAQPVMYKITLNDPGRVTSSSNLGLPAGTRDVHWTRTIHLVDNPDQTQFLGIPRMQPVVNRLYDLRKLYGASAEMFWKNALQMLIFKTQPQLGGDVEVDEESIRDSMENIMNGLQREVLLRGMDAQAIAPQVADPVSHIEAQIEAICIKLGIPIRKFKGSERGELASSQDEADWNDKVHHRREFHNTPRIVRPFLDRLIRVGVLPVPPNGYCVEWPDLSSLTLEEKARISMTVTQAVAQYVKSGGETIIPLPLFLGKVLVWPIDDVQQCLAELKAGRMEYTKDFLMATQGKNSAEGRKNDPKQSSSGPLTKVREDQR